MPDELQTFLNRLKLLSSIDLHEIEGMTEATWCVFSLRPYEFFIRADDPTQAAIWAAIMKREVR